MKIRFVILLIIFIAAIIPCVKYSYWFKYERRGECIIRNVEAFKNNNRRLPVSLYEINIREPEGDGPYYKRIDEECYIVFFSVGFDNSYIYYSCLKEWKDEPFTQSPF